MIEEIFWDDIFHVITDMKCQRFFPLLLYFTESDIFSQYWILFKIIIVAYSAMYTRRAFSSSAGRISDAGERVEDICMQNVKKKRTVTGASSS
jgi:hypothetical protein